MFPSNRFLPGEGSLSRVLRVASLVCAFLMILIAFQSHGVQASSPTGSEYNHALAANGGTASASFLTSVLSW